MPLPVPVPDLLPNAPVGHKRYTGKEPVKHVEAKGRNGNFQAGTTTNTRAKKVPGSTAPRSYSSVKNRQGTIGASTTPNPKPASQQGNGKTAKKKGP